MLPPPNAWKHKLENLPAAIFPARFANRSERWRANFTTRSSAFFEGFFSIASSDVFAWMDANLKSRDILPQWLIALAF